MTACNIKISRCELGDKNDVKKAEEASFNDAWSVGAIEEELCSSRAICLKAVKEGRIVGFAFLKVLLDEGEILRIAVLPDERKKGIGQALLARLIKEAYEAGVQSIFLEVREKNTSARALYEKNGFEAYSERKNYYGDENAVLYKKIKEQAYDSSGD